MKSKTKTNIHAYKGTIFWDKVPDSRENEQFLEQIVISTCWIEWFGIRIVVRSEAPMNNLVNSKTYINKSTDPSKIYSPEIDRLNSNPTELLKQNSICREITIVGKSRFQNDNFISEFKLCSNRISIWREITISKFNFGANRDFELLNRVVHHRNCS